MTAAVTVISPSSAGYLTAKPTGNTGQATIVNFTAHTNITNTSVLQLGANGSVTFTNNGGSTIDLAADINGYYLTA